MIGTITRFSKIFPWTWQFLKLNKEINNDYQYLWLNSTCLLRSCSGVPIKWTPLVHDKSVRFMEMSALKRVHLKIRSPHMETKLIILVTAIKVKSKFFQFNRFHDLRNWPQIKRSLKLNFTTPLHWYSANHKRL